MGAEVSSPYEDDDMPNPEPVHYVLRHGVYVRHFGEARDYWPPSSSVFRSQAPPALEHADIMATPGSLRTKTLAVVQGERMIQLKADIDAQEPIRVAITFGCDERPAGGFGLLDGAAGLGLADDGIWLPAGLRQPWKGKPFRVGKYAEEDGSCHLTIEVRAQQLDPAGDGTWKRQPEERTEVRLVPRGPDEKPGYDLEVKRQYVYMCDSEYDLLELYGQAGAGFGEEAENVGNDCVICLIEQRDTAILPCRHLCLCASCADVMRLRSQTCPICRQEIKSLLQVEGKIVPPASESYAGSIHSTPRGSYKTPRGKKPNYTPRTSLSNFSEPVMATQTPRGSVANFSEPRAVQSRRRAS